MLRNFAQDSYDVKKNPQKCGTYAYEAGAHISV